MTNKKLISTLLVILLIFNLTLNISAISSDNNYIEDYNDSYSSNVINRLNDIKNQRINEHKIEEPAPEDYDQSVIDYINNNPVEDSADVSVQSELNEQEIILPQSSMNVSALSESGLLPDELKIEPVNSPFNLQANAEESVDLTTGSLTYKKTLLSLPGRNGLNLDISVKYNSIDAVISKNEFDDSSNIRVDNGNNFAIGWSFGFPQIKGNKNRYGLGQDKNLVLPDGSAFKIDNDYENLTEDLLLSLQNYKLNDLYFIRKADTKEYILTCEDGKKYYFDGTYGNITKMEDRFGNSISFEYEEIDFYRGTFFDFLYNPTTYTVKMNLLKEITDSTGRIINFDYDISSGLYGQEMETIKISMDNITYATITLDNVKSYNGRISTLRSIKDGEERSTDFTYEEELSYINEDTHQANGSAFLLTSIKHPTGGTTQYEYLKSKRTAQYWVPTGSGSIYTYNYDTFKVSSRIEPDKTLQYHYVNDYSGYPYSHLDTDLYKNPTGYIADSSMTYQTIVEDFDKATIYTFDYRHKNIEKQTYVNRPFTNRFSPALGRDNSRVIVNGKIYQIGISKQNLKQIYIYTSNGYKHSEKFLMPYDASDYIRGISGVKTHGNNIYVFFYDYKTMFVQIYNTALNTWSDGGSYNLDRYASEYTVYAANGIFYICSPNNSSDLLFIYDQNKSVEYRWTRINNSTGNFYSHLCNNGDKIYFRNGTSVLEYNMTSNTITTKTFDVSVNNIKGFSIGGLLYMYGNGNVYRLNYSTGISTAIASPFETNSKDVLRLSSDGNLYIFAYNQIDGLSPIYRFNPNDSSIELATFRLIKSDSSNISNIIMGNDTAHVFIDEGGYEEIPLTSNRPDNTIMLNTQNTFNDNGLLTHAKNYILKDNDYIENGVETFSYVNGRRLLSSKTDILGNKTTYEYNTSYYLPTKITEYADTENAVVTTNVLTADNKNIASTTMTSDHVISVNTYTYDITYPGNMVQQVLSVSQNNGTPTVDTIEYGYDSSNSYVSTVTNKNVSTFNSTNFTSSTQDVVTAKTYNTLGLVATETDANNHTTSYTYNKNGWLTRKTYPDNTFESITYDWHGEENKITTSYNNQYYKIDYYDGFGRIIKNCEKGPGTSEKTLLNYMYYDGKLYATFDPTEMITEYAYDAFDRVVMVSKADSLLTKRADTKVIYDDFNRKVTTKNLGELESSTFQGNISESYYDIAGRKIKKSEEYMVYGGSGFEETTYSYDYMGNIAQTTDANGNITTNTYDDLGHLTKTTNALNQNTLYEYDDRGNLKKVTTPGNSTIIYEYDALGRLLKTTDAMDNAEYYAYDNNGNRIAAKDRKNQIISFTYDLKNRNTLKSVGDQTVAFTYDALNNVTSMEDETGLTEYTYKFNNLLESITTPDEQTITYTYNTLGFVTSVEDYSGQTFSYTYDVLHQPDKIIKGNTQVADYDYNPDGTLGKVTYPEGYTTYSYDNGKRLTYIQSKNNNNIEISSYFYEYDNVGNQTYVDFNNQQQNFEEYGQSEFTYDALNRLIHIKDMDSNYDEISTTQFTYDANSNMLSKTVSNPLYSYSYNLNGAEQVKDALQSHSNVFTYNANNQLLKNVETLTDASGSLSVQTDFGYDANGNMLSQAKSGQVDSEVIEYAYDGWNRLSQVTDAADQITSYAYNGAGQRTSKTQNNTTTKFYWDRNFVSSEAVGSNFTAVNYVGPQGIFARQSNNSTDYLFRDVHGNVVNAVNNGNSRRYIYDAFGNELNPDESDTNPLRYCGEYYDGETGFTYLRNRYYNPQISRFINEDPARDGLNWFMYCGNSPLNFADISGLEYDYLRKFVEDLRTNFYGMVEYRYGVDSYGEYVSPYLGGPANWAAGQFYYDGAVIQNNPDGQILSKSADNINGTLYMQRGDFYNAMGINYMVVQPTGTFTITANGNALIDLGVALVVGGTAESANISWVGAAVAGTVASYLVGKVKFEEGTYKVKLTIAEVQNGEFFESIITREYYKQVKLESGGFGWALDETHTNTKYNGRYNENLLN